MYNFIILTKRIALEIDNAVIVGDDIVIKSFKHHQVLGDILEYLLGIKPKIYPFGAMIKIKRNSIFSHSLTVRRDDDKGAHYNPILIIGDININNMSNSEIDSLIAEEQRQAMEEYNS
jgi:hypothetical protein